MNNKILGLDGIRGIAVLVVIFTHLGVYTTLMEAGWLTERTRALLLWNSGVYTFFVLSGFLITTLLIQEYQANGRISVKNFYIRRTLRIFPLYFLVVGLIAVLSWLEYAKVPVKSFYYAFTYTYNFVPKEYYSGLLGHTWSLGVEEHFYLLWPLLFSMLFGARTRLLLLSSVATILIFIYLWMFVLPSFSNRYFVSRWTVTAGSAILIGVVIALLLESGKHKSFFRRLMRTRPSLCLGVAAFFNAAVFSLPEALKMSAMALGAGLIIAWISLNQGSVLVRALEFKPLRYIGLISYGLYMWQGFFLSTGPRRIEGVAWPPDSLIGLVFLCIVAPLSFHYFERPILRLKNAYVPKRTGRDHEKPSAHIDGNRLEALQKTSAISRN